ncbi:MAG: hypothetical protein NVSMB20_05270 [Bradyrhizobium sp.]
MPDDPKPKRKAPPTARYGNGASVWPKRGTTKENWVPNPNGKKDFGKGTNSQGHNGSTPPELTKVGQARLSDAEMLAVAKNTLVEVMTNGRVENAKVSAATYLISKIDGPPEPKRRDDNDIPAELRRQPPPEPDEPGPANPID